jgi:hypothetical protein
MQFRGIVIVYSVPHRVQTGSVALQVSYPMGTVLDLPVREANHSSPSLFSAMVKNDEAMPLHPHTPL